MIKITNISKTFSGNQVLNDISLEIEEGDVVALIGASGLVNQPFSGL
ncbi:Arginine transport ATP-binding protein ArtM [Lactococcus lactis]|nr:Arginine transport ATP-binding protein ArtM [Lactococcus lactis]